MIDPNIPVLSAEDIAFLAIAPHKAGPYAVARLLATIAAKDAALADRDREIKHLRESAGPDSCADYVIRNQELESKLRAAEMRITAIDSILMSVNLTDSESCLSAIGKINAVVVRALHDAKEKPVTHSEDCDDPKTCKIISCDPCGADTLSCRLSRGNAAGIETYACEKCVGKGL